ncbi:hypothetical protein [Lentilactobacillus rapi]|uniref:hypothetical protein n=1 Tax=Lentilactobacillus rapi TaxID=481723 RepID=UPI0006D20568|nr:hypothetical protein [Lentilactobacillus rapi]
MADNEADQVFADLLKKNNLTQDNNGTIDITGLSSNEIVALKAAAVKTGKPVTLALSEAEPALTTDSLKTIVN